MKVSKSAAAKEIAVASVEVELAEQSFDRQDWTDSLEAQFGAFDQFVLSDYNRENNDAVSLVAKAEGALAGEGLAYVTGSDPAHWGEESKTEAWIAWAMDTIRDARLGVEYAKARAEAIVRRAERRASWVEAHLWPYCELYAMDHMPAKGKTITIEGTDQRLQWRRQPDRLVVQDERAAIRSLEEMLGFERAQAEGYTRVKEEVSVSKVKAALSDGTIAVPAGCQVIEGTDKLILAKGRRSK